MPGLSRIFRPERSIVGTGGGGGVAGISVGARSRRITDDDVTDGVGLPGTVGVAETGVCVVGEAVTVEVVGDDEAVGVVEEVAGGVGEVAGTGDGDADGDAVPRVGVAVGTGVLVGGTVGFVVVGVGVVAVADGCADAALGVGGPAVAAEAWEIEPPPSAIPATSRDAADWRNLAARRRRADFRRSFARRAVTCFPVICAKTASTPILTRSTHVRYATQRDLSSNCEKTVRTCDTTITRRAVVRYNAPA